MDDKLMKIYFIEQRCLLGITFRDHGIIRRIHTCIQRESQQVKLSQEGINIDIWCTLMYDSPMIRYEVR